MRRLRQFSFVFLSFRLRLFFQVDAGKNIQLTVANSKEKVEEERDEEKERRFSLFHLEKWRNLMAG